MRSKNESGVQLEEYIYDTFALIFYVIAAILIGLNSRFFLNFWSNILFKINDESNFIAIIGVIITIVTVDLLVVNFTEYIIRLIELIFLKKNKWVNFLKHKHKAKIYLSAVFLRIISCVYAVLIVLLIIDAVINYGSSYDESNFYRKTRTYDIAQNIVNEIVNSNFVQRLIISNELYNGVTIEQAMETSLEIKNQAKEITANADTDIEKARRIYDWIGINIEYDSNLANQIGDEVTEGVYGAKYAYNNKSGICFDFATLFASMIDSINLPVRVVVGNAYNGEVYGPHAWNEVYLEDESRWVNVDTTFWGYDDSFDSDLFEYTHNKEKIAWEN